MFYFLFDCICFSWNIRFYTLAEVQTCRGGCNKCTYRDSHVILMSPTAIYSLSPQVPSEPPKGQLEAHRERGPQEEG